MVIKNTTTVKKEHIKGVMYAANCDNSRYRTMKLIFNGGGLLFGMLFVSSLMPEMIYGTGNKAIIIVTGILCGVFLLIGMYGMDFNNYKKFGDIYSPYIESRISYEIDSEEILVKETDKENIVLWKEIDRWKEDGENFYLFKNEEEALIISKNGFTQCKVNDLRELATAIMYVRKEDDDKKSE